MLFRKLNQPRQTRDGLPHRAGLSSRTRPRSFEDGVMDLPKGVD